jgi:hypothetical protein
VIIIYGLIKEIQIIDQGDNSKMISIIVTGIITFFAYFLIFSMKLKTRIDETGISYQFLPFHFKPKIILWENLSKCYVRKYSPIMEFGGWGFRGLIRVKMFGIGKNGRAYNVKGNIGIQMELKNEDRILIGTQRQNDVERVLATYKDKLDNVA